MAEVHPPLLSVILQHPVATTFTIVVLILAFSFGAAYGKLPSNRASSTILRAALEQITHTEQPDQCFGFIEEQEKKYCSEHSLEPWTSSILDAGTGRYSLEWIHNLQQKAVERGQRSTWCAITADERMFNDLSSQFGLRTATASDGIRTALDCTLTPQQPAQKKAGKEGLKKRAGGKKGADGDADAEATDTTTCAHQPDASDSNRVIMGKWSNPALLKGEKFDVILADYLLGAVDGFEPYTQHKLFPRLKEHMHSQTRLYFVGMEPLPDHSTNHHGELIVSIAKLRDACILLGGGRPYREYPMAWVLEHLGQAGYRVIGARTVPIHQSHAFVVRQINVGRRYVLNPKVKMSASSAATLAQLGRQLDDLEVVVGKTNWTGVYFGHDYVVAAAPNFDK